MGYLGNTPQTQGFVPAVDVFSGNGSTTAFTLSRPVASVSQVEAVIENVPQSPVDAFTVSGNTITFTSAPPSGSSNIYVRYTSPITQVIFPSYGTVGQSQMTQGAPYWDVNGNLGVGTNSPAFKLDVQAASGQTWARIATPSGTNNGAALIFQGANSVRKNWAIGAQINVDGGLEFTQSTTVGGTTFSTPAMVLDISGNLLVGTTSASETSGVGAKIIADTGSGDNGVFVVSAASTSARVAHPMYSTTAGTYRFYVDWAGAIHATSTSIAAISDATLKTNVKDLETGIAEVMSLKPRRFDWINGDGTNVAGFIAQEVAEVLPELVVDSLYSKDEDGNPITKKNLKMGDILPTLVKAIQEQQAIIEQLRADVAALKGGQ